MLKNLRRRLSRRDLYIAMAPAMAVVLTVLFVTYRFLQPAPPKKIVMAVWQDEGSYRYYFRRYQAFLAKHGITLEAREVSGSEEALKLLRDEGSSVDLTFAQSGTLAPLAPLRGAVAAESAEKPAAASAPDSRLAPPAANAEPVASAEATPAAGSGGARREAGQGGERRRPRQRRNTGLEEAEKEAQKSTIVSLGALYYQPLWVFYRGEPLADLRNLQGKRIAVGAAGTGTHSLATRLLAENGVGAGPTQLLELGRAESIEKLTAGEIDALFLVSPAESPFLRRLAATPGVRLLSIARADAYARRFQFLSKLVLPRGVYDLAADVPAHDVVLVAPTANLVAKRSLHPALSYLLMRAATDVHYTSGLLDRAGEFPAPMEAGVPLSEEAKRFYKSGAPLLQRYLPFWLANLIDRLWVMIVPLLALLLPLAKAVPPLYRWRIRSRIFRWYARLKEAELRLEHALSEAQLQEILATLDAMEQSVHHVSIPLSYSEEIYSFRQHVNLVRSRVREALRKAGAGAGLSDLAEKTSRTSGTGAS